MRIEAVSTKDAEQLLEVYGYYVRETAVSFEYDVPSVAEFQGRIAQISQRYPYWKAVGDDGVVLGYAYANTFKSRAAYDWSVETTIYVRKDARRAGTGRALYQALERSLGHMGILNMNACIAVTDQEDPRLTRDSVYFHEKMGFSPVGRFHNSGYKFSTWYDMMWMEKMLGTHTVPQKPVAFGDWNAGF
jgi:phosphinothricin acetyltransferase